MPTLLNYRYRRQMSTAAGCPHDAGGKFIGNVFRAVHEDINDPRNFAPKAVLDPALKSHVDDSCNCSDWGLSMFETAAQLRRRIKRILKSVPYAKRKIGDRCAELKLTSADGRRTSAKAGHFTFFEFDATDYKAAVVSVAEIPP